jgi:hypothetical protein
MPPTIRGADDELLVAGARHDNFDDHAAWREQSTHIIRELFVLDHRPLKLFDGIGRDPAATTFYQIGIAVGHFASFQS